MKKKISILSCVGVLVVMLAGCSSRDMILNKVYTEENMTRFFSEKVAIDDITSIDIESNYANFEIIASDDYYVEYSYYYINNEPTLTVKDNKLTFSDSKMNTGSYSINQKQDNYLKIYIPTSSKFDSITVDKSSGNCYVGSFVTNDLSITNHYGDTVISNCQADEMEADLSSGNLTVENSIFNKASVANAYGDVELDTINDSLDWMDELSVQMSSGSLSLSKLYCKKLDLENSYGQNDIVDCAMNELEGKFDSGNLSISNTLANTLKIDNSYGNISMNLLGTESDYRFDIKSEYGNVTIGNSTYNGSVFIDHNNKKEISLRLSSGNTEIKFIEQ